MTHSAAYTRRMVLSLAHRLPLVALVCFLVFMVGCRSAEDSLTGKEAPGVSKAGKSPGEETLIVPFVDRTPELEAKIQSAREAVDRRDREVLGEILSGLLEGVPEDLEIQALVAHAHWLKGRYDRAHEWAGGVVKQLEPYVRERRDDVEARQVLSRARMVMGDLVGAEVQMRVAVRKGLRRPLDLVRWTELLFKRENTRTHEALLKEVMERHPDLNQGALCSAYGQVLIELGHLEKAGHLLGRCLEISSSGKGGPRYRARLLTVKGLLEIRRGKLENAEKYFRKALEFDDTDSDARHNLALVSFRLGSMDEALSQLRESVDESADPEHYYLLGEVLDHKGDTVEAIDALSLAYEHLELWSQAHSLRWKVPFLLGRLLARKRHYGRAQQALEQALDLDPEPSAHRQVLRHLVWVRQKGTVPRARK